LDLDGAKIPFSILLFGCSFEQEVGFHSTQVTKMAVFIGVKFWAGASFVGTQFFKKAYFRGAQFFGSAHFSGGARFYAVTKALFIQ
jgi:hypothetical protein